MKPCNSLATHYSAYIDGELTPLEAVAIRKHLSRCATCRRDVQQLENMKLAVHMHKDANRPPTALKHRLEATFKEVERQESRRIQAGVAAALAAAAIIVIIALPDNAVSRAKTLASTAPTSSQVQQTSSQNRATTPFSPVKQPPRLVDESLFGALVDRHHGIDMRSFREQPGLLSFEALPVRLMDTGPHVRQVVNASYQRCIQTRSGASLAVLDATQLKLPPQAEASLDRIGFYVEHRGSVEVRVSQSGERLFVLLTDKAHRAGSVI